MVRPNYSAHSRPLPLVDRSNSHQNSDRSFFTLPEAWDRFDLFFVWGGAVYASCPIVSCIYIYIYIYSPDVHICSYTVLILFLVVAYVVLVLLSDVFLCVIMFSYIGGLPKAWDRFRGAWGEGAANCTERLHDNKAELFLQVS